MFFIVNYNIKSKEKSYYIQVERRCSLISGKELLINEQIGVKEARVIGSDGSQLGILSIKEALEMAYKANLDLVMIAPKAETPVCKIMDYGKYRFEQSKKEKEQKKNNKVVDIKEIRLSLNIDTHDFNTKVNQAQKMLKSGDKIKTSIRFRGRELAHPEVGIDLMHRFAEQLSEVASIEKEPKLDGRSMQMFLVGKA